MKKSQLMQILIDKSTLNVKDFTEKIGVNRSSYHLWKTKKTIPKKTTINKIAQVLNIELKWLNEDDVIIVNNKRSEIETKTEKGYENILELINYQRDEIARLKAENKQLKQNPVESVLFKEQTYDWKSFVEIKISYKGIKRRIYQVENIDVLAKSLDATTRDIMPYFDLNNWHFMDSHPINKLITKQSLKSLKDKTNLFQNILTQFKNFGKFFSGDHFITLFVDYQFENKVSKTINHCKIIDSDKFNIVNKVTILND